MQTAVIILNQHFHQSPSFLLKWSFTSQGRLLLFKSLIFSVLNLSSSKKTKCMSQSVMQQRDVVISVRGVNLRHDADVGDLFHRLMKRLLQILGFGLVCRGADGGAESQFFFFASCSCCCFSAFRFLYWAISAICSPWAICPDLITGGTGRGLVNPSLPTSQ